MLSRLADLAVRSPRRVLAIAVLAAASALWLGGGVADRLHPFDASDPASESVIVDRELERVSGAETQPSVLVLVATPEGIASPVARRRISEVERVARLQREVVQVSAFHGSGDRAMVARDGRSTLVTVRLRAMGQREQRRASEQLNARLEGIPHILVGGLAVARGDYNDQSERDLRRAELIAFPLLFLLSFLFFRSLVAAALPVLVGGLALIGTFALLRVINEMTAVSVFALNLSTSLGLGLAIDYSLLVVSRYREEMDRSGPGSEALRRTLGSAGRTVLFSSLTVAAALGALLVFPQQFVYSMGLGGMLVALLAAAVTLLVLPSVLVLLGTRINALAPSRLQRAAEREARPLTAGPWYRVSQLAMRRAGTVAVLTTLLLLLLAAPLMGIRFSQVGFGALPAGSSARAVDEALDRDFPLNLTVPLTVTARAGVSDRRVAALVRRLSTEPGVRAVGAPVAAGSQLTRVDVVGGYEPTTRAAERLVQRIRAIPGDLDIGVTGFAARTLDQRESYVAHLPRAAALIALSTIAVLFVMTGSLILPVQQLVMNALTVASTFGLLVWVFQDGRLEGVLGYESEGYFDMSMRLLLVVMIAGLATDYGVFLLARIKEARDAGAGDANAIAAGLERTGRIITAAAVLFAVAIGAFATSELVFLKENGVGTAAAVLLDATIIRALLVPASLKLLGRHAWWAPPALSAIHRRLTGLAREPLPAAASQSDVADSMAGGVVE